MILITQPRVGTSHNEILSLHFAAEALGWTVVPAPGGWRLDEELTKSGQRGVPYGSQTFCEVIAQQMGWTLKQNSFDWLSRLDKRYLKRDVKFMTLAEAKKIQESKFIKPADDKVFPAKVYEPGTLVTHESIPDNTPTLVSDVVEWDIEYRCFMDGSKVKTWSSYLFYGEINDPRYHYMVDAYQEHPAGFVNRMMADMNRWGEFPTVPCTIDVGLIRGKGMAVIETNQCWAAGTYGCDPMEVLSVLEHSCEPENPVR